MNAASEISANSRRVTLTVNGTLRDVVVEPRALLADVLRDDLDLTGTHLGCEQGVCGACTVLVNGEPQRSCIALAADLDGDEITTIEGFETDEVMAELRKQFSACHALQCGFCTPGMLVTGRDIVLRLGEVDETKIRRELAGNLCRCTGYVGIVDALTAVCAGRIPQKELSVRPLEVGQFNSVNTVPAPTITRTVRPKSEGTGPAPAASKDFPNSIGQTVNLAMPPAEAWQLMRDLRIVARCIPGAEIISLEDGRVTGQMHVALGPIKGKFAGEGEYEINDDAQTGMMIARGRDAGTGSSVSGQVSWSVLPAENGGTVVEVQLAWRLMGPLAQFNRGGIVRETVKRLAEAFASNLEKHSRDPAAQVEVDVRPLGLVGLLSGVVRSSISQGLNGILGALTAVRSGRTSEKPRPVPTAKVGQEKSIDTIPAPTTKVSVSRPKSGETRPAPAASKDFPNSIGQTVNLAMPPAEAWQLMRDLRIVARCIPGAEIISLEDGRVTGQMHVALGPIKGKFAGEGEYEINDDAQTGMMIARGRDAGTGSSVSGQVSWSVLPAENGGTVVEVQLAWRLMGPLAQFNRGGIVRETVKRLAEAFASNLEKHSRDPAAQVEVDVRPLGLIGLLSGVVSSWFNRAVKWRN